ncbi:MAG: nuclear transport factor 2 family protein [Acidimicrobiia bacterium]|nr:nuclear transport factor 2 family protein [Acidimicrobiia bacterium]
MRSRRTGLVACLIAAGLVGAGASALSIAAAATTLSTQDYIDIEQLYARYNQTIDSGDHAGWARTFTEDGTLGNSTGWAALEKTSANWRDNRNGSHMRHWNTNLLITGVAPEGVRARVYLMVFDHTTMTASQVGVYDDLIVRTSKGWLFKERSLRSDARPAAQPR